MSQESLVDGAKMNALAHPSIDARLMVEMERNGLPVSGTRPEGGGPDTIE